jgi:hypothetical protein
MTVCQNTKYIYPPYCASATIAIAAASAGGDRSCHRRMAQKQQNLAGSGDRPAAEVPARPPARPARRSSCDRCGSAAWQRRSSEDQMRSELMF